MQKTSSLGMTKPIANGIINPPVISAIMPCGKFKFTSIKQEKRLPTSALTAERISLKFVSNHRYNLEKLYDVCYIDARN